MKKYDKSRVPFLCIDREIAEEMVETLPDGSIGYIVKNFIKLFNGEEGDKDLTGPESIYLSLLYKKALSRLEGYLRQHPTKDEKNNPSLPK